MLLIFKLPLISTLVNEASSYAFKSNVPPPPSAVLSSAQNN